MGDSGRGLLLLAPIIVLVVVVFVLIKCASCSTGRWAERFKCTCSKAPRVKTHKRNKSDLSEPSESARTGESVDLEVGPNP